MSRSASKRTPRAQTREVLDLLADFYDLLERYAPPWYSKELRERLMAVLEAPREEERKNRGAR